jgi:hypothetical protein
VFAPWHNEYRDEIRFVYQTEKWDKPAKLVLKYSDRCSKLSWLMQGSSSVSMRETSCASR